MESLDKELKKTYLKKDKNRKLALMLNYDLVEMFKETAKTNNIKITQLIEAWIINYLENNNKL